MDFKFVRTLRWNGQIFQSATTSPYTMIIQTSHVKKYSRNICTKQNNYNKLHASRFKHQIENAMTSSSRDLVSFVAVQNKKSCIN